MKDGKFLTLAIESSCDETSVAVVADGRTVLSDIISSQIKIHTQFGGVVPEIASRHHLTNINEVTEQAMREADVTWDDIDLIGVTYGPGLIGALLIGVATAKAYAFAKNKPLVGVHHIQGHISANYIQYPELKPPFMAMVLSGGHTNIINVTDYNKCTVLGGTRDDAAGEAFDKVARVIGLGYPGGPKIDKAAKEGNPHAIEFKRVMLEKGSMDFSFSGIKTGVLNYVNTERQAGREISVPDVAASFQAAVVDVLVTHSLHAVKEYGIKTFAIAGGVASNSHLREAFEKACKEEGIEFVHPSPILCTDNAAMIGSAGYYEFIKGYRSGTDLNAVPNLQIGEKQGVFLAK